MPNLREGYGVKIAYMILNIFWLQNFNCFSISSSFLSAQHLMQGLQSPVVAR